MLRLSIFQTNGKSINENFVCKMIRGPHTPLLLSSHPTPIPLVYPLNEKEKRERTRMGCMWTNNKHHRLIGIACAAIYLLSNKSSLIYTCISNKCSTNIHNYFICSVLCIHTCNILFAPMSISMLFYCESNESSKHRFRCHTATNTHTHTRTHVYTELHNELNSSFAHRLSIKCSTYDRCRNSAESAPLQIMSEYT